MTTYTTTGVALRPWPRAIKPSEITLHLHYNTSSFTSPFTRTTQTTELPGALHALEANFPSIKQTQVGELRAFFATLRGSAGRFIFPAYCCRYQPPAMYQPERVTLVPLTADDTYITADTTTVRADATRIVYETQFGVSACPDSVTIVGTLWLNSRRAPLKVGGYISWDDATGWRHLHIITALATSSGGVATLTIEPPMRFQPTPATPIHVHAPSGVFMLADDGQGALRMASALASMSLSAMQAFPVQVSA